MGCSCSNELEKDKWWVQRNYYTPTSPLVKSGYLLFKCDIFPWRKFHVRLYADSTLAWYYDERRTRVPCYRLTLRDKIQGDMKVGAQCVDHAPKHDMPRGTKSCETMFMFARKSPGYFWFICPDGNTFSSWMDAIAEVVYSEPLPKPETKQKRR